MDPLLTALLLAAPLLGACASGPPVDDPARAVRAEEMAATVARVRTELQPLDLASQEAAEPTEAEDEFFRYYGLDVEGVRHDFGSFTSGSFVLAAHVFRPAQTHATVVVLHGYYDHAGTCSDLIHTLVDAGYAVATFDLPGHGLSSGERASIDEFATYRKALERFLEVLDEEVPRPLFFIGHSTGCAVALDLLLEKRAPFEKLVFLAPLVRSNHWGLSKVGLGIGDVFVDDVGRAWPDVSSDEEYLLFRRRYDPLQYDRFPLAWARAMMRWEDELDEREAVEADLLILQGDEDGVVEWKYNLPFLEKKVRGTRSQVIEGARHQLLNEAEEYETKLFQAILDFLNS